MDRLRKRRRAAPWPREAVPAAVLASPRESMRCLPGVLQPFLTWLTGMPLFDETPLFRWNPFTRTVAAVAILLAGLGLSGACWRVGGVAYLGLVPGWLLTVNGMRDLYTVTEHYCAHDTYSRMHRLDVLVGECVSTLLLAAPLGLFRREHLKHHAVPRLDSDPDVVFLVSTGFRRGMSRAAFRRYIARTCLSPRFHLRYLGMRLVANLSGPPHRTVATLAYLAALAVALTHYHGWLAWLVAWVVPVVLLFQIASLINYHSEHLWDDVASLAGREAIARVCVGRFCGDSAPGPRAGVGRWLAWWARVLFVHLPHRLLVLPGDQSQHDLHHRRPRSDWANAAFTRRDDVIAGAPGWPVGYIDVWGSLVDHLDACVDPWGSPHLVRHPPHHAARAAPAVRERLSTSSG